MSKIILALLILCSCVTHKESFVWEKEDYFIYNNDKYISTNVDTSTKVLYQDSPYKIAIRNSKNDTIYVFSTVLSNSLMFYSPQNLSYKNNAILIKSYYQNFMIDAVNSGVKKFNFIRIIPKDSLVINFDKERIIKNVNTKAIYKGIILNYFYFKKNEKYVEGGILNISKFPLEEATIHKNK